MFRTGVQLPSAPPNLIIKSVIVIDMLKNFYRRSGCQMDSEDGNSDNTNTNNNICLIFRASLRNGPTMRRCAFLYSFRL